MKNIQKLHSEYLLFWYNIKHHKHSPINSNFLPILPKGLESQQEMKLFVPLSSFVSMYKRPKCSSGTLQVSRHVKNTFNRIYCTKLRNKMKEIQSHCITSSKNVKTNYIFLK